MARKHIASCLEELQCVLSSLEFLRSSSCGASEDSVENKTTASGCQPIGFDTSLNSRLSAPTPPRAIKVLSWKDVRIELLFLFYTIALCNINNLFSNAGY